MLLVNADDLGRSREETNAVFACHAKGRVTSASAMVFMADSERAACRAREAGVAVGLHLNLSEPFTAGKVQPVLRRHHERVCRFLRANKYALVLFHPLLVDDFAVAVQAQYDEFWRLHGHAPTHVDGHQHMHLATNVLAQRLLPDGARVRRSFSFTVGERGGLNRWYRARVDRALFRRYVMTDYFFSLSQHLDAGRLERLAQLARGADVEVMVHPARSREFTVLMSDEFGRTMQSGTIPSTPLNSTPSPA